MTSLARTGMALATVLLVALVFLPASSPGQSASMKQRVASAKQQYIAQEYEVVIRLLTPVVQSPIATISAKVAAYELLGLSYLILGDEARARVAFENLLGLDQGHMLDDPSGSPKLRRFYDSVKESFVPGFSAGATVTMEHAAPLRAIAGRRVELAASIVSGRELMDSVSLRWRRAGLLTYRHQRMRGTPRRMEARFLLPADTASYRVEYYIEARNRAGHAVGRVGAPEAPLTIKVSGALNVDSTPVYRKWWFWTLVGAAVVGGLTAGIVVSSSNDAPAGSLEPNPVRLK